MSSKIGELIFFVYFLYHIHALLLVNKEKHLSNDFFLKNLTTMNEYLEKKSEVENLLCD